MDNIQLKSSTARIILTQQCIHALVVNLIAKLAKAMFTTLNKLICNGINVKRAHLLVVDTWYDSACSDSSCYRGKSSGVSWLKICACRLEFIAGMIKIM